MMPHSVRRHVVALKTPIIQGIVHHFSSSCQSGKEIKSNGCQWIKIFESPLLKRTSFHLIFFRFVGSLATLANDNSLEQSLDETEIGRRWMIAFKWQDLMVIQPFSNAYSRRQLC